MFRRTRSAAPRLRADVSVAETDYGAVVLDERSGRYWQLNATGSVLVGLVRDGRDAAPALCERYDLTDAAAREQVATFLDLLSRNDLLER